MELGKLINNCIINFEGKIAVYNDDLKGNILGINENEQYNGASCIKIFILIELFNQIYKGMKSREDKLKYQEN